MPKKLLLTPLVLLFACLLSGCNQVPDVPLCAKLSDQKGWCTYTISAKEFYVDNSGQTFEGKNWTQLDDESLRVPASSWAAIKAYILKQCKKDKDCSDNIGSWDRKMSTPTPSPSPEEDSDFALN